MAAERQEGGSASNKEPPWVAILTALAAVLLFLLGLAGLPDTVLEMVLAIAAFIALVAVLVYMVEAHLSEQGKGTFFKGKPIRALVAAAIVSGALAGILTELASTAEEPPVAGAIVIYETQVEEVLRPIRQKNREVFADEASEHDAVLYEKNARELSSAYRLASNVLAGIEPPRPDDQVLHSLLSARLKSVGTAYAQLADAVGGGVRKAKSEAARSRVRRAIRELLQTEEALAARGYRFVLIS